MKIKTKIKPVPKTVNPEDLGLVDGKDKKGGIIEALSKEELVNEKIRLIQEQIDQFVEGKVPESLLRLMAEVKKE